MKYISLLFLFALPVCAQFGNATRLQGRKISPAAPTDTQVICWTASTATWGPCTGGGGPTGPAGGALSGTYPNPSLSAPLTATLPYTASVSAQTALTVTAATHGVGVNPVAECFDNATPANHVLCSWSSAANGDVVFSWSPDFTGTIKIWPGSGAAGTGTVTHTGSLAGGLPVCGDGAADITNCTADGTGAVARVTGPTFTAPIQGSYEIFTAIAAPGTPTAGVGRAYLDSTTKVLALKNDAGTISTTVIADAGASNNFLTAISAGGVISKAQPSFSNISGTIAAAQNTVAVLDGSVAYCADAGSTDDYACTLSPAPAGYVTGARYRFKANTANTGAATVNFNSLGAKTIKKAAGGITTDLADNDIRAGQFVDLVYDGTNMEMQSTLGNAAGGATLGANTFTGAQTISVNGALSAPGFTATGTWINGGTATTTKPYALIEVSGATSANWSTAGTGLAVNAASGFTGNLFDLQLNGASRLAVASTGVTSHYSDVYVLANGSATVALLSSSGQVRAVSGAVFGFNNSTTNANAAGIDTGVERTAAGVLGVINGTANTFRDLKARNRITTVGSNIASASTIAPTEGITHITGTTQVDTITAPSGFAVTSSGGCIVLVPDGAFTTSTGGNIAIASTAVVSKALTMCYDNGTSKWYPSY